MFRGFPASPSTRFYLSRANMSWGNYVRFRESRFEMTTVEWVRISNEWSYFSIIRLPPSTRPKADCSIWHFAPASHTNLLELSLQYYIRYINQMEHTVLEMNPISCNFPSLFARVICLFSPSLSISYTWCCYHINSLARTHHYTTHAAIYSIPCIHNWKRKHLKML